MLKVLYLPCLELASTEYIAFVTFLEFADGESSLFVVSGVRVKSSLGLLSSE